MSGWMGCCLKNISARLRDDMLPLVEHFQRMSHRHLEALGRKRNAPAAHLERLEPLAITVSRANRNKLGPGTVSGVDTARGDREVRIDVTARMRGM